ASVRPEPGSNSPNKNPQVKTQAEFESEKSDQTKRHQTNWHQKNHTHTGKTGSPPTGMAKTTNKNHQTHY
ncbi:MAG: hypothetical protein KDB72_12705, partial [Mycobacterium sp.]|nr:hypothetical protein [Mycobacterium sp.]